MKRTAALYWIFTILFAALWLSLLLAGLSPLKMQ
jgi:hypothetical protein